MNYIYFHKNPEKLHHDCAEGTGSFVVLVSEAKCFQKRFVEKSKEV